MNQGQPNMHGTGVNTTYVPNQGMDEVVPALPAGQQGGGAWGGPATGGAWHTGPGRYAPVSADQHHMQHSQQAALQFTDTTANQYVSGQMNNKQEERTALVQQNTRSDDPGAANSSGAAPVVPKEDYSKYAFYNARRYRPYFDVDTKDVLWRVGNSLIGLFRANFIEVTMKSPDLYGPFWVATTLVLMTAITGNFASYIEWRKGSFTPVPTNTSAPAAAHDLVKDQWFTDYTKLASSAGIFYGYIFVIGLFLFFLVKWFKGELRMVNVICVYGYALTIFIPVSMACVVPVEWLRWVVIMVATVLSGGFLLRNFKAAIFAAAPARAIIILLVIFLLHLGLGLALKLYFFHY